MTRVSDLKYIPTDLGEFSKGPDRSWGIPDLTESEAADLSKMPKCIAELEQERDRFKKIADAQSKARIALNETYDSQETHLLKTLKQLQARDDTLVEIARRARDHPAYDDLITTVEQAAEIGGDACDWWCIANLAERAIEAAKGDR